MNVEIDPSLLGSRRVRVLSGNPPLRSMARWLVHRRPGLWHFVSAAYAGACDLSIEGLKIHYVLGPHDAIGDKVYWCGSWEKEVCHVFIALARKTHGLVLDVGSNFGIYALLACSANPSASVVAWEPVPFIYERLKMSVSANHFRDRIQCRMAALSSVAGESKFFLHADSSMGSLLGSGQSISVHLETADDVISSRVGLVKIDVEGHELEVLHGMKRILREHKPPVIFEALSKTAYSSVVSFLAEYEYKTKSIDETNFLAT